MIPKHSEIRPAVRGKSDFYSWQLFRWMREKPWLGQVYAGTWNTFNGVDRENPVLYIGLMDDEGWFHGKRLRALCTHRESLQSWAFGPAHDTAHWKDVTADFWADYLQRGVCAIHGDFAHNWQYLSADHRRCHYCGKEEIEQTVYTSLKVWEAKAA
ncbi:hypothetical protein [Marinobacter sp. JSM 1782161]|uniref:hypothetical protein n=1 Tax=Marinobacter sp. JSM 1782161 TaxID=2685906 RepID=UPI001403300D|nr:hypothetical protein [Marinobacter sp. JSM 1782161]